MTQAIVSSLAAALLLLTGGSAAAAMASSGVISSMSFELTDLDPLDGVAPTVTFFTGPSWTTYARALDTHNMHTDEFQMEGLFGTGPQQAMTKVSNSSAQVQISGDLFQGTGLIGSQASADPGGAGLSWSTLHGSFVLSAHTKLVVTAHVVLTGSTTIQSEGASASYFLDLKGPTGTSSSAIRRSAFPPPSENPAQPHSFSFDRLVSVTLTNADFGRIDGVLDAYVGSGGSSNTTLVPEPQTWATLGLGLGCLAVRRRLLRHPDGDRLKRTN